MTGCPLLWALCYLLLAYGCFVRDQQHISSSTCRSDDQVRCVAFFLRFCQLQSKANRVWSTPNGSVNGSKDVNLNSEPNGALPDQPTSALTAATIMALPQLRLAPLPKMSKSSHEERRAKACETFHVGGASQQKVSATPETQKEVFPLALTRRHILKPSRKTNMTPGQLVTSARKVLSARKARWNQRQAAIERTSQAKELSEKRCRDDSGYVEQGDRCDVRPKVLDAKILPSATKKKKLTQSPPTAKIDLTPPSVSSTSDTSTDGLHLGGLSSDEWELTDIATVHIQGGAGGDGCSAFRREKYVPMGGPSGGNGGDGGDVWFRSDNQKTDLDHLHQRTYWTSDKGRHGSGSSQTGAKGKDLFVDVPVGTTIYDQHRNFIVTFHSPGMTLKAADGGKGGRGNKSFKNKRDSAPVMRERGEKVIGQWYKLEMKLYADVGLIGIPNAGKTSLLRTSTQSRAKVADYAFTTLKPNLGVWSPPGVKGIQREAKRLVLLDIPGILEGAHSGRGMGFAFLRHVENCKVILHIVPGDSPDPFTTYLKINEELELFNPLLIQLPQIVLFNKIDLLDSQDKLEGFRRSVQQHSNHTRVMGVSALTGTGIEELMMRTHKFMSSGLVQDSHRSPPSWLGGDGAERVAVDTDTSGMGGPAPQNRPLLENDMFEVETHSNRKGMFLLRGYRIERLFQLTDWTFYQSRVRVKKALESMGVISALLREGVKHGDSVGVNKVWGKVFSFHSRLRALIPMADFKRAETGSASDVVAAMGLGGAMTSKEVLAAREDVMGNGDDDEGEEGDYDWMGTNRTPFSKKGGARADSGEGDEEYQDEHIVGSQKRGHFCDGDDDNHGDDDDDGDIEERGERRGADGIGDRREEARDPQAKQQFQPAPFLSLRAW
eukprot:GHVN01035125.1.p2 GENE.GHVN01035125.1~~GHVN01035125.1.p2  ORF type:complete len:889 (+),score=153.28 GHVN01035125.1:1631-4297(+)